MFRFTKEGRKREEIKSGLGYPYFRRDRNGMVEKAWGSGKSDGKCSAGKTVPGFKYAKLPDVELYPVCGGYPVYGHSEVWIAVSKEDK